MVRTYLTRGLLVGLVAALLAVVFAKVVGEPQIAAAEKFEHAHAPAGEPEEPPMVSRAVQDTVGLGAGLLVAGAALGGIYSLAFAFAYGRLTRARARACALLVAGGLFSVIFLVPFLKYPANPPSVGSPDTIDHRTAVYFLLMLMAVGFLALAIATHRQLSQRLGASDAALAAVALFVSLVTLAYVVMPSFGEVPDGFPAQVLWRFRLASFGTQLVLWLAIGVGFGLLTERSERRQLDTPMVTGVG